MSKITNLFGISYEDEDQYEKELWKHRDRIEAILKENWNSRFVLVVGSHEEEFVADNANEFATIVMEEIGGLPIKDGVDLVVTDNGNLGCIAYYSGWETVMEIVRL